MMIAERAARIEAEAHAARTVAENSNRDVFIAHLKLQIAKLRRELYGGRSERQGAAARLSLSSRYRGWRN
jgi:hypothetical protein